MLSYSGLSGKIKEPEQLPAPAHFRDFPEAIFMQLFDSVPRHWQTNEMTADTPANVLAAAVADLAAKGVRLTARPGEGEYEVNFRNGTDATAYVTDDLADAIEHGHALAKSGAPAPAAPGKRYRRPRRMTPKAQRRRMIRQHNRRMRARAIHKADETK